MDFWKSIRRLEDSRRRQSNTRRGERGFDNRSRVNCEESQLCSKVVCNHTMVFIVFDSFCGFYPFRGFPCISRVHCISSIPILYLLIDTVAS